MDIRLVTADQIDLSQLGDFLRRVYREGKAEFLADFGGWWYRGNNNRLVILEGDKVAGYCAVIPSRVVLDGQVHPFIWWVDLIIAPEYRGKGLQPLLDKKVKEMAPLRLGFPNEPAAKIHRRKGWNVREDLRVFMLPLRPTRVRAVMNSKGPFGKALKFTALALAPIFSVIRWRIHSYNSPNVQMLKDVSPEFLESIFSRSYDSKIITTYRDSSFFQWRYLDAPYRDELVFFVAGSGTIPTHYLIARYAEFGTRRVARILDLFGDFKDRRAIRSLLLSAAREAVVRDCSQVTIHVTLRELVPIVGSTGFILSILTRFCWHSESQALMSSFGQKIYWTIGDSDNDEPE